MENPNLRSQERVVAKFDQLVKQRDSLSEEERYSVAFRMLTERIIALGWALRHPLVDDAALSEGQLKLLSCVS